MSIANTVWRPTSGKGEYSSITPVNIVDPTSSTIELADPSGVLIVSPDVEFTDVEATVWTENEGI